MKPWPASRPRHDGARANRVLSILAILSVEALRAATAAATPSDGDAPPKARATGARANGEAHPAPPSLDAEPALPATLRRLTFSGLEKTQRHAATRELGWREGGPVDAHAWDLGLARLWNTGRFAQIAAKRMAVAPGTFDAHVTVDEIFSLHPTIAGAVTPDASWLRLGVSETNLFGTMRTLALIGERFNDNFGGALVFREPRLLEERLELDLVASRLARPRPTFTLLRALVSAELGKLLDEDHLRAGVRLEGGFDDYAPALDGTLSAPRAAAYGTVAAPFRMGRVDRVRTMFTGATIDAVPSATYAGGPSGLFGGATVDARIFFRAPGDLNLAARTVAAASSATTNNFVPYIGGLETVRGYPDGYGHGGAYVAGNVELRWLAFDSNLLAIMPVAFVDGALVAWERNGRAALASVGGGVRFVFNQFGAAGIRADLANALVGPYGPALSLGAYQFF